MSFTHPSVLPFLFLVPLAALAGAVHHARSSAAFGRLLPGGRDSPGMRWFLVSGFVRVAAFSLFAACGILSLSDPVSGFRVVRRGIDGADFAFCVDVSRSMTCVDAGIDGKSPRIEDARDFILKFLSSSGSARVSLTVFKGEAQVLVPMTEDVDFMLRVLESMGPDIMTQPGTDIRAGLAAATSSFPQGERRARFIVLVSDGESTKGDPSDVSSLSGIPVLSVATGSAKGGTIRMEGDSERFTAPDRKTLKTIADATGGSLLETRDAGALSLIASKAVGKGGYADVREPESLSAFFALCAALFLALNAVLALFPFGKGARS